MIQGNIRNKFLIKKENKYIINREEKQKFYGLSIWKRKLRIYHLREEPLCQMCLAKDKIVSASVVDHIIPFENQYDDLATDTENFSSLCHSCHSVATTRETAKPFYTFENYDEWIKYKYKSKIELGIDGYYF